GKGTARCRPHIQRDAGEHGRGRKGDDDRLQASICHDDAVDEAASSADCQAGDASEPDPAGALRVGDAGGDAVREPDHRTHGKVDAAGQHDDRLTKAGGCEGQTLVDHRPLLACSELGYALDVDGEQDGKDDEGEDEAAIPCNPPAHAAQAPRPRCPSRGDRGRAHRVPPSVSPTAASTRLASVRSGPDSSRTMEPSYMTSALSHNPTISVRSVEKKRMPLPAA